MRYIEGGIYIWKRKQYILRWNPIYYENGNLKEVVVENFKTHEQAIYKDGLEAEKEAEALNKDFEGTESDFYVHEINYFIIDGHVFVQSGTEENCLIGESFVDLTKAV